MAAVADKQLQFEADINAGELNKLLDQLKTGGREVARAINESLGGTVTKQIVFETRADDSGAKRLVAVERERLSTVDQIINKQKQLNKTEAGSLTSLRQQVNEAKQARDQIARFRTNIDDYGRAIRTVNDQWTAQNRKVVELERNLAQASASGFWAQAKASLNAQGLFNFLNGLTSITQGLQSAAIVIGQVVSSLNQLPTALSKLQQFELTFAAINATQAETALAFAETERIAIGLGTNLTTVRDTFQQLSPIVLNIGGNLNNVSAITEALSSRFAAFGLSGDKARRVLNAVSQAFGKGRLQAEELTQQIGEADVAFRVNLATALGVTSKQLNELVKNGEITDKVLLDILPSLSKSSLLFGRLGDSATSAADALKKDIKDGGVTIEQFNNQLNNLNQINLNDLSTLLKPFIVSVLELQAIFVDLGVVIAQSEAFRTLAEFLNSLAVQFTAVVRATGSFLAIIFKTADIVFKIINGIDDFVESLTGLRPIVTLVAGVITTKLIVSLTALGIKGVTGLAVAGMKALTIATSGLSVNGFGGLAKSLGGALANFTGLKAATFAQIQADFAAVASTQRRIAAISQLRAIEAKGGLGAASGNIQLAAEAAGRRAVARASAEAAAAGGQLSTSLGRVGDAARKSTPGIAGFAGKIGAATAGLRSFAGSALTAVGSAAAFAAPLVGIGLVAVGLTFALQDQYKALQKNQNSWESFKTVYDGIAERANKAIDSLNKGGVSTAAFEKRLNALNVTAGKGVDVKIGFGKANEDAKKIRDQVNTIFDRAKRDVKAYSSELDTTGEAGEKLAIRLSAAEQTVQAGLDATRRKRDDLIDQATKGGNSISEQNKKQLAEYQRNITKLEQQREELKRFKQEAAKKGVPVEIDTGRGETVLEVLKEKIKSLESEIVLEVDPDKFAEAQSQINGLAARLAFLKADRVKIKIDVEYKAEQAELQNQEKISRAIEANLKSQVDLNEAINQKVIARLQGEEKSLTKRIDKLKDAGAAESEINKLEQERKKIKDQIEAQEVAGLQAKLQALPAIQAAERASLEIAQKLVKLDQERLLLANRRAFLEGKQQLDDLNKRIGEAEKRGDTDQARDLRNQFNIQLQYLDSLQQEARTLEAISAAQEKANQLERNSLSNKQEAERLGLQSEIDAYGRARAEQQTQAATAQTADNLQASANATGQAVSGAQAVAGAYGNAGRAASEFGTAASNASQAAAAPEAGADVASLGAAYDGAAEKVGEFYDEIAQVPAGSGQLKSDAAKAGSALGSAVTPARNIADELSDGASQAQQIASAISNLDGLSVNVNVNGVTGLWTGGPTTAGQTYRVNELGQEGFLSAGGSLSAIRKPKNALWRAPSAGTVIPAHIWSEIDAPKGGVQARRASGMPVASSGVMRMMQAIKASAGGPGAGYGMRELAQTQAQQSRQIGKLAGAIQEMTGKEWKVDLNINGNNPLLNKLRKR